MSTSRRNFLKLSGLAVGTLHFAGKGSAADSSTPRAAKPLRILILGGTGFIGPHEVRYAIARGHKVTLFNRGKTNPALFPEVQNLQGDRSTGDYQALKGGQWDAVVDNPTTIPRWVRQAATALKGRAKQYVFISTISVYAKNDTPDADESAAVLVAPEPESEEARKYYGPLKALSEQEAEKAFRGNATIIRPGLIVGPGDPSDRFTYWPARLAKGGEVLAPGEPTDPVQIIDARDLAEFTIRVCEDHATGVYNCTGPRSKLTMAEMLGGVRSVMSSDAYLTWVDAAFLGKQNVGPWIDMPVWVPPTGETAGFARRNIGRALSKGLTFRTLASTARDTLDFYQAEPEERRAKPRAGLAPEREQAVLAAWHARSTK
jgi:2'-hydroxyisoflavone reductase